MHCSQCKCVSYCSVACQKKDWTKHKTICHLLKKGHDTQTKGLNPYQSLNVLYNNSVILKHLRLMQTKIYDLPNFSDEYEAKYPDEISHIQRLQFEELKQKSVLIDEKEGLIFNNTDVSKCEPHDILKRWGTTSDRINSFLKGNPKPGDIFEYEPVSYTDSDLILRSEYHVDEIVHYQTIRNFVCSDIVYEFGHTYVSFGFVDLFQLMFGSYKNTDATSSRLRYLCFDSSPIVVARGYIVWRLLKTPNFRRSSVLQIWFSSCWDDETLMDFRRVCSLLLSEFSEDGKEVEQQILTFIKHWSNTACAKEDATQKWLKHKSATEFTPLSNFIQEEDRILYSRYLLTGVIFCNEFEIASGNVSMFSMPNDGKLYYSRSENIFTSIDFNSSAFGLDTSSLHSNDKSFMDFVEKVMINKLNTLSNLGQTGQIEIIFKLQNISVDDFAFAAEVKAINPYRIEWCNIPDWMVKSKFIRFARACSGQETVHTLESMIWGQRVFGSSWFDFFFDKQFLQKAYFEIKPTMEKKHQDMWNISSSLKSPMTRFIKPNFLGYPENIIDKMFGYNYADAYIDYFFTYEDGSPMNRYYNKQKILLFNPFSKYNQSFHIDFTFNAQICLSMNLM